MAIETDSRDHLMQIASSLQTLVMQAPQPILLQNGVTGAISGAGNAALPSGTQPTLSGTTETPIVVENNITVEMDSK